MTSEMIASLKAACEAAPGDVGLLLHLARAQVQAGLVADAIGTAARVLAIDAGNHVARELIDRALASSGTAGAGDAGEAGDREFRAGPRLPAREPVQPELDWDRLEAEIGVDMEPPFVEHSVETSDHPVFDVERPGLRLADVGGMAMVKQRLEASFLAPLRNPELRKAYGKSLRGGLLMYGPPGCGKTLIARALAGELGAGFISLAVADVISQFRGEAELNIHDFFQAARRAAPVVVFIDELDTLGQRRTHHSSWSEIVNQLLTELDGVEASNEGLFILGATNQPWSIDPALRRPGRFDRTVVVLPPDAEARAAIFR